MLGLGKLRTPARWIMLCGVVIAAAGTAEARHGEFPPLIDENGSDVQESQAASAFEISGPVVTTASALLVVLSLFAGLVWVSRRFGGQSRPPGGLPEDLFRNLGTSVIDGKTRVTFLQIADRILVVGQTTTGDPQTLAEITDPDECQRIVNRCDGRPEIIGQRASSDSGSRSQTMPTTSTAPRRSITRRPLASG